MKHWRRLFRSEQTFLKQGYKLICGIDEAGRGPLAGPVVAAAVVIDSLVVIEGLNDSKLLSSKKRDQLFEDIYSQAISVGVGVVDSLTIDRINILQATFLAMQQAVDNLLVKPQILLIDGNLTVPHLAAYSQKAIVKGDRRVASIAAASVIAKVTRDRLMEEYHEALPSYNFHQHKGYATKTHLLALKKYGPSPIHRLTFAKVKD